MSKFQVKCSQKCTGTPEQEGVGGWEAPSAWPFHVDTSFLTVAAALREEMAELSPKESQFVFINIRDFTPPFFPKKNFSRHCCLHFFEEAVAKNCLR